MFTAGQQRLSYHYTSVSADHEVDFRAQAFSIVLVI